MGELNAADASTFTGGRLPNNAATQSIVDAALAGARRYCGWFVSPVQTAVVLTVDGPGGRVLSLPTLNLTAVTALVENGVAVDVTKLDVSRRKGTIEKYPCGHWTSRSGAITVTMTHGFTEAEAADWRRAVLHLVDKLSVEPIVVGERDSADMKRKRVDNVETEWFADSFISSDARMASMFAQFRILPTP